MSRIPVALLVALVCACRSPAHEAYFQNELRFLRTGVDLAEEEKAVRRVLAQRHLSVVAEVRAPGMIALGAQTYDGRLSAVRVITGRGVVVAEDAGTEDLFSPGQLALLEDVPTTLGDYSLVGLVRTPAGRDEGCVSLYRLLPDGSAVEAVLDVNALGSRACVAMLARGPAGRLAARIGYPLLFAGRTPTLQALLAFRDVLPGRAVPLTPVAKLVEAGDWLEAERARLAQPVALEAPFPERHAVGVSRAAVALLAGQDTERQLAAYRETVGRVRPGSANSEVFSDAVGHIERGWLDAVQGTEELAPDDAVIIEPPASTPGQEPPAAPVEAPQDEAAPEEQGTPEDALPEDAVIIQPEAEP